MFNGSHSDSGGTVSTWALRTNGDTPSGPRRTALTDLHCGVGPGLEDHADHAQRHRHAVPAGKQSQAGTGPSGSGPSGNGPSGNGPSGSEASGNETNDKRPRLRRECGGSGGAQLKALVQLGAERELARRIRQRYHLRLPASNAMSVGSPHRHRHSQASACAIRAHIRARISHSSGWPPLHRHSPAFAQGQCGLSARLV